MFKEELDENKRYTFFLKALVAVFLVRLIISIALPITGDEAYFVLWGKNLDYGYYDHTPLVGWILALFFTVSDATWWLRLPSTLLPVILSYGIYHILKQQQSKVAVIVALTFLVAPVNAINILITTDTPLILFSFFSTWYFYQAINSIYESEKSNKYFVLAGLFLGLAFFSKYFAVLLGFTFGLYILLFLRNKRGFTGLFIVSLMVLPFVVVNLWWNYNNCWSNILFNLYNRTSGQSDSLGNLYKYITMLIYLFSPVLLYFVIKNIKEYRNISEDRRKHFYFWIAITPLSLFFILLVKKSIGLHWMLSFYPFAFIAFSSFLNLKQWNITFYFMLALSSLHLMAIALILILPVTTFTSDKFYIQDYEFGMNPSKFLEKLKPYEKDYTFGMIGYGMASVASYNSKKHFIIFSGGSVHARLDDKITNYKELSGKNILLVRRSKENIEINERYFERSDRKTLEVDGVRFELVLGQGFKYELYRDEILSVANEKYYSIPDWLPVGSCGFKEKYNLE